MWELGWQHRSTALGAAALALALLAVPAHAEEAPRAALDWRAPAGCPERDAVLARVEQLLGARETTGREPPLDVREYVSWTRDGRFHAELVTVQAGVERSRSLDAATCAEIAEASAVVIALAIAPDAHATEPSESRLPMPALELPPDVPVPAKASGSAPPRDAGAAPSTTPSPPVTLRPRVGAGVAADLGATAPVALGVSVEGGLRYGRYAVFALRVSFFPERTSTLASQPNRGVRLSLATVAPLVCAVPLELPVELVACGEVDFGYLHAIGFGPPAQYHRSAWWVAPGAGLTAAYPAKSRFRALLSADALFPLRRTEFVLTNAGVPHRLPVVAPRLGLYLELSF